MRDLNTTNWLNIYPNIRDCKIQTFNDKDKTEKSQSRILNMTDENLEKCIQLQCKLPYWIFFSVNPMNWNERNKESVKNIQTWICDIDTWDKAKQLDLIINAPLPPSLVVESNHGFHLYYLAQDYITAEQYEYWNFGICNYFGWDVKVCKDTARVLRLPWYFHNKGEPYLVMYREDLSSKNKYSYEEITTAFPEQVDVSKLERKEFKSNDNFWSRASELNTKQMLQDLSWTSFMNFDSLTFHRNSDWTEQIYVNWRSTSSRIDNNWLIWSYDKGWPTRLQWLAWYRNVDYKELAKLLKQKFPYLDEQPKPKVEIKEATAKIKRLQRPDFTWGDDGIDNHIGKLRKWQFVILAWETGAGKTTFANFMARKNLKSCYYVLEDSFENVAMRYALKKAGITKEELNNWTWGAEKEAKYNKSYERYANQWVKFIDVGTKIDVEQLMESMLEYKEKWYEMFFIDNLWFITGKGKDENEITANVSNKLLSFCINNNVCIVLIHHFRKSQKWYSEREVSDMRGSGKIWDDAFTIVYYERDYTTNSTFLAIKKDREWGDLKYYEIWYDYWDFYFVKDATLW